MGDNVFKENVLRYCEEIIKGSKSQNIILKEEQKDRFKNIGNYRHVTFR